MDSTSKLKQVFADSLGLPLEQITDDLKYHSLPEWDSIAHMSLVAAIDDTFSITLSTDDVINLSSFAAAKEILTKYGVNF